MRAVHTLLNELHQRDIKLWISDGQLKYNAPSKALSPLLLEEMRQHKAELLTLFQEQAEHRLHTEIQPSERPESLPLSFAQQRLWFLAQLEGADTAYHVNLPLRMGGLLDVGALHAALNTVVQRHESLRTTFCEVAGNVQQIIASELTLPLPVVDLQGLPATEQAIELQKLLDEVVKQPFDLATGPLLHATLYRLQPLEHLFLLNLHHIIVDGWSLDIFMRELAALYSAYCAGESSPLAPVTVQYADYTLWQRTWLQGSVRESQLKYWQQRLIGAPTLLELPTDWPRPAVQSYRGDGMLFMIERTLTQQLQALSNRQGATLFMTLLAAFKVLLYRYSGQTDIVVGTPIANRTQHETEALIGMFANTLALRSDLGNEPTFTTFLDQVRDLTQAAYEHQYLPFEMVVEALRPERSLSHSPIFQVMFVLQNISSFDFTLAGLTLHTQAIATTTTKFDLNLELNLVEEGLLIRWQYNSDLFAPTTIQRMAGHFEVLLQQIVANPDQQISDLSMLTAAEYQQIVHAWNDTAVDFGEPQTIHALFEQQVARTPDAVALVFEQEHLTYAALNARANQLAHYLIELGVQPDTLVAVAMERSLELVVSLLAVLKAGGAYVPLDPTYPSERLAFMIQDANAPVLLIQDHLLAQLPLVTTQVVCLARDWPQIVTHSSEEPSSNVQADHLAYVIYTSGSTGRPKGAMNAHRGVVNRLLWMQDEYRLTCEDRVLQKTPFSFDVSVWEFFWPLLVGAQLVVARPEGHKDPDYLVEVIQQYGLTTLHFVPSMLNAFLDAHGVAQCSSVRRIMCSGEALAYELQERFFAKLPAVELHNLYGPTEAAVDVTYWACQPAHELQIVPIGRPVANTQMYVLNRRLQPMPVGVPGELHIGGIQVGRGYLNRPELAAEKFIMNPFGIGKLYKTGDLARWLPDGNLEYLGRIDQQVKIRGFRIELGEIEAVLSQHPSVQAAVVMAREDNPGEKRLVAYFVGEAKANMLREHLAQRLPDYMLPLAFVALQAMPLTPNGKLDRRALPVPDYVAAQTTFVAPRNALEQQLAAIWASILGLDKVGVHDNFFALGGHSLLATKVISQVRAQLQVELPLKSIFEAKNLGELGVLMNARRHTPINGELLSYEELI